MREREEILFCLRIAWFMCAGEAVGKVLELAISGTPTSAFEFPIFSESGMRIEVLLNANPRRDANGRVFGVCGIGQDITERKEAEMRLALMAGELHALIASVAAVVAAPLRVTTKGQIKTPLLWEFDCHNRQQTSSPDYLKVYTRTHPHRVSFTQRFFEAELNLHGRSSC